MKPGSLLLQHGAQPAPAEVLQWCLVYRDGRQVPQFEPDGRQRSFGNQSPDDVRAVWLAYCPEPGIVAPVGMLEVPAGARVELFYTMDREVELGSGKDVREPHRTLLAGWRMHDGTRRECWLRMQPDGVLHIGVDPKRPWPEDAREPGATA